MVWQRSYTIGILFFIFISSFFVSDEVFAMPKWPFLSGIVVGTYIFSILLADAFRIKGQGLITDLPTEAGGHSSFNPHDVRIAVPSKNDDDLEKFAVFATGGFSALGFEFKGKEAFCVTPPEFLHTDMTSGMICTTKFHQVDFDDLPDYVQNELIKLPRFNAESTRAKGNLWFGMTSKEDGSNTPRNHNLERKFIAANQETNYLKNLIKEMQSQERERQRKSFIKYPESYLSKNQTNAD
jgi:hypothetical protein